MTVVDDLEAGDFLYQANEEIFLVVIENKEDNIDFAVHGWRTIDKDRLRRYLDADNPVIHTEEQVEEVVANVDDPEADEKMEWLRGVFEQYEQNTDSDSAYDDFTLNDND